MDETQAKKIIMRLRGGFNVNFNPLNEVHVQKEYLLAIQSLDYDIMNEVITRLIRADSDKVPSISCLLQEYHKGNQKRMQPIETDCKYCNGKGFMLITKIIDDFPYEYIAYCDRCEAGEQYKYDGRKCRDKRYQTNYVINPISMYFDPDYIFTTGGEVK